MTFDPQTTFVVRVATAEDSEALAVVHRDSIVSLGSAAYPEETVAEWARPCTTERYVGLMKGGEQFFLAFACANPDSLLGFSSYRLEAGKHRTAVYVAGSAARRGVGRALFRIAESAARTNGATELYVNSSLVAVDFYRANGFVELGRGAHRLRLGAARCSASS